MRDVKIEVLGHGRARVYVDGVEVNGVREVRTAIAAGGANVVTLEIIAKSLEVNWKPEPLGPLTGVLIETTNVDSAAVEHALDV